MKKQQYFYRTLSYIVGLLILAVGITLNTKTNLGVSPIISVPYSISTISGSNFGNMTLVVYIIFIIIEMILHIFMNERHTRAEGEAGKNANKKNLKFLLLADALQFPLSLVFTRFLNIFSAMIPEVKDQFGKQFLLLLLAIVLTGIGVAMSLNARMVPNPGDGIVQAISDAIGKKVGFTKNCFDLFNICITITVSLVFTHHLIGIGIGTVVAVLGVGRVIACFNHFFLRSF